MSDLGDRCLPLLAWGALLSFAACQPLNSARPPPEGSGGTPCTPSSAVQVDTVVIALGVCNPACIEVPAGTVVTFLNQDAAEYQLAASGPGGFEVILPPHSAADTPPLAAGTVQVSNIPQPGTAVTILVD